MSAPRFGRKFTTQYSLHTPFTITIGAFRYLLFITFAVEDDDDGFCIKTATPSLTSYKHNNNPSWFWWNYTQMYRLRLVAAMPLCHHKTWETKPEEDEEFIFRTSHLHSQNNRIETERHWSVDAQEHGMRVLYVFVESVTLSESVFACNAMRLAERETDHFHSRQPNQISIFLMPILLFKLRDKSLRPNIVSNGNDRRTCNSRRKRNFDWRIMTRWGWWGEEVERCEIGSRKKSN